MPRYGDALSVWPVKVGEVWGSAPHWFLCGDVLEYDIVKLLGAPDMIYVDPPWNSGKYKEFHTFADLVPSRLFGAFLSELVASMKRMCRGPVVMEMGNDWFGALRAMLRQAGAVEWGVGKVTYGSPHRSSNLWCGTFGGGSRQAIEVPLGLHGVKVFDYIVDTFVSPGMRVFDPCCGNMAFLRRAYKSGAIVSGCELIPAKLAQGLAWFAKRGLEIERR